MKTNGNTSELHYQQGFIIHSVVCVGCGQTIAPKMPKMVIDLKDAHTVAIEYHQGAQLICSKRRFVINYAHTLIDSRIQEENNV